MGPGLSPSSEGLYSLARQTDLGQVNCRCRVECELREDSVRPERRRVSVGWDGADTGGQGRSGTCR